MTDGFRERKAARTEQYQRFQQGWKLRPCNACNGSGRYDHNGSPPCGGCDGTGKVRYKPETNSSRATPRFEDALK